MIESEKSQNCCDGPTSAEDYFPDECRPIGGGNTDKNFQSLIKKFPPSFLNPFVVESLAINMSYFDVGIASWILATPVTIYLIVTLDASSTQYNAFSTLIMLPWCLKFIFGMISDGVPILGYRRKRLPQL